MSLSQKKIPTRERLVAGTASVTLVFSAFGLGGIPSWSLHTLFIGGLITLLFSLVGFRTSVFPYFSFSGQSAKRLVRWPFFWLSLLFLIYLLVGALNPAAEVVSSERGWWVQAIQSPWPIWLPTTVRSEFEPMNAWRVIESFTGTTALAWGIWAGLSRRRAVLFVLWSLLLSGACMAFIAILQDFSGATAVLWTFPSSNDSFWGSFFYRNQGVAFLNLILIASGILFFYHANKSRERMRASGPHFLCFLIFAGTATSIGLALSRGGILFGSVISLSFLTLVLVFWLRGLRARPSVWVVIISALLLGAGGGSFLRYVDLDAIEDRFGDVGETIEYADQNVRAIASRATWDMAKARLALGWGAGSFRYIFPMYQREYPEIYYQAYRERKGGWFGRRFYRYAHNDILQFVAEYGLIGSGLIALAIMSMLGPMILNIHHSPYAVVFLIVGIMCACLHATLDFIFNSPAYWLTFIALLTATSKLLRLEAERVARSALSDLTNHS